MEVTYAPGDDGTILDLRPQYPDSFRICQEIIIQFCLSRGHACHRFVFPLPASFHLIRRTRGECLHLANGCGFLDPLFWGEREAVQPCLLFNPVEFDVINGLVKCFHDRARFDAKPL